MRAFAITTLTLCVLMAAACSQQAQRPTEETRIAEEVMAAVESLREEYAAKRFSAMAHRTTPEVYEEITAGLKRFDSVELEFTIRWIEISSDAKSVTALMGWDGTWQVGGKSTAKQGTVLFVLRGKPLTVVSIQRLSPFRQP